MAGRKTYKNCFEKRKARKQMFQCFKSGHYYGIIGLPGPDYEDYINWAIGMGYDELFLYENDSVLFKKNKKVNNKLSESLLSREKMVSYANRDITTILNTFESVFLRRTICDFDFCKTIKSCPSSLIEDVNLISVFTFSLRGFSYDSTLDKFFSIRDEIILDTITQGKPPYKEMIVTNQGIYYVLTYKHPKGTPMVMIGKIK